MSSSNQISVLSPLLVGVATTVCTIIVHGLILALIVTVVRRDLLRGRIGVRHWANFLFVTNATLLALAGHLVEIGLWALSLLLCGEFSNLAEAFYYSAANYTTLGDGTIVISARWRLMGPLEASDGMLMFGLSTAMIFGVIQRLIQTGYRERNG
jgi:hypothetical protein